jgi:hypothetical protein
MIYKYVILQEERNPLRYTITIKIMYDEINNKYIFAEPGYYISWNKNEKIPKFLNFKLCKKNYAKLKKFIFECNV